jgi:hypothetical protein
MKKLKSLFPLIVTSIWLSPFVAVGIVLLFVFIYEIGVRLGKFIDKNYWWFYFIVGFAIVFIIKLLRIKISYKEEYKNISLNISWK